MTIGEMKKWIGQFPDDIDVAIAYKTLKKKGIRYLIGGKMDLLPMKRSDGKEFLLIRANEGYYQPELSSAICKVAVAKPDVSSNNQVNTIESQNSEAPNG